ncbi:MFS transporter [Paenalkalicoccus suaedae]|uniref:MFS transporter n=1 Tax=Paenalkalicoccus suaedae TaxID=2592382 RepID=A0A859FJQ8_9BACI|nr:MFS transporter [Paenalkalicoccus suaedae]QKS73033.1 MFS transporter [Paenalkalicoccus suaedae]
MAHNVALFAVIKEKRFRHFWFTQLFILIAIQFYFISLSWMTLEITGSTVLLGTLLTITALPRLIIMPIGGALTDLMNPKLLLRITIGILLISSLVFTILLYQQAVNEITLMIFAGLFGISTALFLPVSFSMIPKLVDESKLQSANSLSQLSLQMSTTVGPAIAGIIIAYYGLPAVYVVLSLFLVCSYIVSLFIGTMEQKCKQQTRFSLIDLFKDIAEGIRIVRSISLLASLVLISALLNISIIGPQQIGLPFIASSTLDGGAENLGFILSALGAGTLIGSLVIGLMKEIKSVVVVAFSMAILLGISWSFVGFLSESLFMISSILFISGLSIGVLNVLILTLIQKKSPSHAVGRVMSLQLLGSTGIQPLSFLLVGWLLDIISVEMLFLLGGGLIAGTAIVSLSNKNIRRV